MTMALKEKHFEETLLTLVGKREDSRSLTEEGEEIVNQFHAICSLSSVARTKASQSIEAEVGTALSRQKITAPVTEKVEEFRKTFKTELENPDSKLHRVLENPQLIAHAMIIGTMPGNEGNSLYKNLMLLKQVSGYREILTELESVSKSLKQPAQSVRVPSQPAVKPLVKSPTASPTPVLQTKKVQGVPKSALATPTAAQSNPALRGADPKSLQQAGQTASSGMKHYHKKRSKWMEGVSLVMLACGITLGSPILIAFGMFALIKAYTKSKSDKKTPSREELRSQMESIAESRIAAGKAKAPGVGRAVTPAGISVEQVLARAARTPETRAALAQLRLSGEDLTQKLTQARRTQAAKVSGPPKVAARGSSLGALAQTGEPAPAVPAPAAPPAADSQTVAPKEKKLTEFDSKFQDISTEVPAGATEQEVVAIAKEALKGSGVRIPETVSLLSELEDDSGKRLVSDEQVAALVQNPRAMSRVCYLSFKEEGKMDFANALEAVTPEFGRKQELSKQQSRDRSHSTVRPDGPVVPAPPRPKRSKQPLRRGS